MRYESFLYTHSPQQAYSTLVRPALMSASEANAVGAMFTDVGNVARLTAAFPSLYYFPVGEYALLLRQYDSGQRHEGHAISVVEGIAVKLGDVDQNVGALADFVERQAELLDVSAKMAKRDAQEMAVSEEREWDATRAGDEPAQFVAEFLERREQERLFLPFTVEGRAMLTGALADRRFSTAPYFAFGTNSDVLAKLERLARVDLVSFFKTERPSLRDRQTNLVSRYLDTESSATDDTPLLTERPAQFVTHTVQPDDGESYEDTRVGLDAMPIQTFIQSEQAEAPDEDDPDATVLTMQQLPDRMSLVDEEPEKNPLRRVTKFLASLRSRSAG